MEQIAQQSGGGRRRLDGYRQTIARWIRKYPIVARPGQEPADRHRGNRDPARRAPRRCAICGPSAKDRNVSNHALRLRRRSACIKLNSPRVRLMGKNYYTILGVSAERDHRARCASAVPGAGSQPASRIASRATTRSGRRSETFQEITEAFNILNDPERRRQVDASSWRRPMSRASDDEGTRPPRSICSRGIKAYREGNIRRGVRQLRARDHARDPRERSKAWSYFAQRLSAGSQRRWRTRARTAAAKACQLEPMNADLPEAGRQALSAEGGHVCPGREVLPVAALRAGAEPTIRRWRRPSAEVRRRSKRGRGGHLQ